ncbi:MAG: hypothetical protein JJU29_02180 [Verrucomicrobia bacterium]|nr:hypothetical protein [Verrucomicrobiota bacterium]MCH8512008.1 hypothetical protein [Kiritimatiellia bacterium]
MTDTPLYETSLYGNPLQVSCARGEPGEVSFRLVSGTGKGHPGDPACFRLQVHNPGSRPWTGVPRVALKHSRENQVPEARFFLPGFLMGSNRGDQPVPQTMRKHFPRLRPGPVAPPYAPLWHARADQLTHPLAAMHVDGFFLGLTVAPMLPGRTRFNGFFCGVAPCAAVGFTLGHVQEPGIYRSPFDYELGAEAPVECLTLAPGEEVEILFWAFAFPSADALALGKILEAVYNRFHEPPRRGAECADAVADIAEAMLADAYDPERKTFALVAMEPATGEADKAEGGALEYIPGNPEGERYRRFYEGGISWTNGTVIAFPLLQAAHRLGRPEFRDTALAVFEDILANAINPQTGIPFACKIDGRWTNEGWWSAWLKEEGLGVEHPAYLVGQALFYVLKAYAWEKQVEGVLHTDWLEWVEGVLERVGSTQASDGGFPRFWRGEDGRGLGYSGFAGCWVAAAMAAHAKVSGSARWLPACKRAEAFYFENGVRRMACVQTPLDVADAPDAEGILAYLRLARILHELDPSAARLSRLRSGLDYLFSFIYCHNVAVRGEPLNAAHGWSTCGGCITSVCNAVVHCMANSVLDEIAYLWRQTDDPYLLTRLHDMRDWGLQTYNRKDGEFFFGKKGWSPEYFCQSERYVLDIRLVGGARSTLWFAYHPWATAAILEGLCGEYGSGH